MPKLIKEKSKLEKIKYIKKRYLKMNPIIEIKRGCDTSHIIDKRQWFSQNNSIMWMPLSLADILATIGDMGKIKMQIKRMPQSYISHCVAILEFDSPKGEIKFTWNLLKDEINKQSDNTVSNIFLLIQ